MKKCDQKAAIITIFFVLHASFPSNLILPSFSYLSRIAQPDTREEIRSLIAQQLKNFYTNLYNHLSATAQHDEGSITLEFLRDLRAPREIKKR